MVGGPFLVLWHSVTWSRGLTKSREGRFLFSSCPLWGRSRKSGCSEMPLEDELSAWVLDGPLVGVGAAHPLVSCVHCGKVWMQIVYLRS